MQPVIRLKKAQSERVEVFTRAFNQEYGTEEKPSTIAQLALDMGLDWLFRQHEHLFPEQVPAEFDIVKRDI